MSGRWRLGLLLAAALAAFGGSLAGSFHLDDYSIFSDTAVGAAQTRPLTWLTFWLNDRLGGQNPAGYHAVNLCLHLAAVALLADSLQRLLSSRAAWIAAAIFAIHPIQAEAVNYIFARSTLLAAVLCFASLSAWLRNRVWLSVVLFAAALLAKEECVAFPVFLLAIGMGFGPSGISRPSRGWRYPLAAMFLLALAAGLRLLWVTRITPGAGAGFGSGVSPWTYLAAQGPAIVRYFRLLVFPWGFTVDPAIVPAPLWWGVVLAILYAAFRFRVGFWLACGLVLLAPSSSVIPVADFAADRRMYIPLLAFGAGLGILLERVDTRLLYAGGAALLTLSMVQTQVWSTEASLWTQAVERAPSKVRPKIQLARALDPQRALVLLDEAARLAPEDPAIPAERGRVLLQSGQPAQALAAFGRALALAPNDPHAINNRGVALLAMGQIEAARQDFRRALEIDACLFDARLNLKRAGVIAPGPSGCRFTQSERAALAATP